MECRPWEREVATAAELMGRTLDLVCQVRIRVPQFT
jgi:hypothetical protein